MGSIPVRSAGSLLYGSTKSRHRRVCFCYPSGESNGCWHSPIPVRSTSSLMNGSTKMTVKTVVFIWWRERADDSGRIKKISTRAAFFSLSIILLLNVFWFLNQSMPDKNNTNRGQDVVFLTNTALRSRLRHKVLTRSRALSLPENTASDSQATKSSIFPMIFGKNERSCT